MQQQMLAASFRNERLQDNGLVPMGWEFDSTAVPRIQQTSIGCRMITGTLMTPGLGCSSGTLTITVIWIHSK